MIVAHELMYIYFVMYTFIQSSLKDIISFKCTGYHYKSYSLIEQCLIVNYVICVYGIAYEILKAIFQIHVL